MISANSSPLRRILADVITGSKTIDDFRAYQRQLMETEEIKTAMAEYKASYDEFGFDSWKAS